MDTLEEMEFKLETLKELFEILKLDYPDIVK